MSNVMRLVAAASLGVSFIAVVVSVVQESAEVPVSEPVLSPVLELRPGEREEIAKRIAASDLSEDSKSLCGNLVMQFEAWRSGLIENLGLTSIVDTKHDPLRHIQTESASLFHISRKLRRTPTGLRVCLSHRSGKSAATPMQARIHLRANSSPVTTRSPNRST